MMDQMNMENQPEAEAENFESYDGEEQYAPVEGGKKRKRKSRKLRKSKKSRKSRKSRKSKKSKKSRKVRRTKRGCSVDVSVPAGLFLLNQFANRKLNKTSVNKKSFKKRK